MNAQKALNWREKYNVKAMTPVGWKRAKQLASGSCVTPSDLAAMSSFNRHRKNASIAPKFQKTPWKDKGRVAWLGWGGDEGISWAKKLLKEIRGR
jgi:hypothetical protein